MNIDEDLTLLKKCTSEKIVNTINLKGGILLQDTNKSRATETKASMTRLSFFQ